MLLCLCYIMGPILIGTLKPVSLILSFVSQSNLFTLINVLGITNYVLNRAEGEFESVSFDITTSLSTQKKCFTTASSHNTKRNIFSFFYFMIKLKFQSDCDYNIILTKIHKRFCISYRTE